MQVLCFGFKLCPIQLSLSCWRHPKNTTDYLLFSFCPSWAVCTMVRISSPEHTQTRLVYMGSHIRLSVSTSKQSKGVTFEVTQFWITSCTSMSKLSQLEFHYLGCSEWKNKIGLLLVLLSLGEPMNNLEILLYFIMCYLYEHKCNKRQFSCI